VRGGLTEAKRAEWSWARAARGSAHVGAGATHAAAHRASNTAHLAANDFVEVAATRNPAAHPAAAQPASAHPSTACGGDHARNVAHPVAGTERLQLLRRGGR
jgi:hypothetical protein